MRDKPTKEELEFINKMDAGEHKIKYNKDGTASLIHKRSDDDIGLIPLEWSDRDCLKVISEDIENAIESIRENFSDNFAEGMSTLEVIPDIIKLHISKDDLWNIGGDKAKKEHEEYLKRGRGALN